ncbi:MAG: hypothetical protein IBJ02_03555 [Brevundimonas sp.]|nr:hypothetical protein [Brevundimonas sp.]
MTSTGRAVRTKSGPGRIFYLVAVVPLVVGLATMGVILARTLPNLNSGLQQIVVPGERELTLEPGQHTVFLETRSVVDGRSYVVDDVPGLQVEVRDAAGTVVPVHEPVGYATYSLGARTGHAIQNFEVETAGTYRIRAGYPDEAGPATVIAVGQGFVGTLLVAIFSALVAMMIGLALTTGLLIWVYSSRRRMVRSD